MRSAASGEPERGGRLAPGCASWISIYPLDVVKSRIQAAPGRYLGMWDCATRSVREEGWSVLGRGLTACMMRAFVVNAAIFTAYELAVDALDACGL